MKREKQLPFWRLRPHSSKGECRRNFVCLLLLCCWLFCCVPAAAQEDNGLQSAYAAQLESSGASALPETLPEDTKRTLGELGVVGDDFQAVGSLTPQRFFQTVFGIAGEQGQGPLKAAASTLAILLLCALVDAMKLSFGERPLEGVVGIVGALCVSVVIVNPIVEVLVRAGSVIQSACVFSTASVPVMAGILAAMGKPASAASMQGILTVTGDAVQVLCAQILVPMLQALLAMTVVSAISPDVNLGGLLRFLTKAVKWILGFSMTFFSSLLAMRSFVSAGSDTLAGRAAKFVVSSFVPVVGSALSEAMRTVTGCVELLRGGVGAFGLLAILILFLPSLLSVLLWMLALHACSAFAQLFAISELQSLFDACVQVLETLLAVLLCSMTVLVVSGVVLMMMGGSSA